MMHRTRTVRAWGFIFPAVHVYVHFRYSNAKNASPSHVRKKGGKEALCSIGGTVLTNTVQHVNTCYIMSSDELVYACSMSRCAIHALASGEQNSKIPVSHISCGGGAWVW